MLKNQIPSKAREAAEDVFFGQIAIIVARWFLIGAGILIAIWSATDILQLSLAIVTLIVLMGMNFFAHARYMTGRPINQIMLLFMSLVDVTAITLMIFFWNGKTGLDSDFFVLYYPMLIAWALVFGPGVTTIFSLMTLAIYATVCLLGTDPQLMFSITGFETLAARVITLAAMSGLGTYYYRRQRDSLRTLVAKPIPSFFK